MDSRTTTPPAAGPGGSHGLRAGSSRTFEIVREELIRSLGRILLFGLMILAATGVGLVSPLLFRSLIDRAIPTGNLALTAWLLAGMVVTPIAAITLSGLQDYLRSVVGESVNLALKRELFEQLLAANVLDLERLSTGAISERLLSSSGEIGRVYISARLLPALSSTVMLAGNLTVMGVLNLRLLLVTALAFPLTLTVSNTLGRKSRQLDEKFYAVLEDGRDYVNQVIPGMRTVRAFNGQARERNSWGVWMRRYREIVSRSNALHTVMLTLPGEIINNVVLGLVFGAGALWAIRGQMSVGSLVAFTAYVPRVYGAFKVLLNAKIGTEEARAAAGKLDELFALDREDSPQGRSPDCLLPAEASRWSERGASVEFHELRFHYGRGDFGLENVTFQVRPGEMLGIVGGSGGGKSTLFDLLLGFYRPHAGSILLDGVDTSLLTPADLRRMIAIVPQEPFLWNASIRTNLEYPDRGTPIELLKERAQAAQLDSLIERLPEGYETVVGERGISLSGGERQRLAIARALRSGPRLLLLDEVTAALDALTELRLREALEAARRGTTALVIAHRLTTLQRADRILVIDRGRVAELGTPGELLARNGIFSRLYRAQQLE